MSAELSYDSLLQGVLRLPAADRSHMASLLIDSLDDDIEISSAWRQELDRRVEAVQSGSMRTIPHEEVMGEIQSLLTTIRLQNQASA